MCRPFRRPGIPESVYHQIGSLLRWPLSISLRKYGSIPRHPAHPRRRRDPARLAHGRRLSDQCPHCRRSQPWLARDTAIGWCAWCGSDLVLDSSSDDARAGAADLSSRERWMAEVCGDLVAAAGRGDGIVDPTELGRGILWLLDVLDERNRSAFARRIGASLPTPGHWIRTGAMRFDYLLRMCWRAALHPDRLLLADRSLDLSR